MFGFWRTPVRIPGHLLRRTVGFVEIEALPFRFLVGMGRLGVQPWKNCRSVAPLGSHCPFANVFVFKIVLSKFSAILQRSLEGGTGKSVPSVLLGAVHWLLGALGIPPNASGYFQNCRFFYSNIGNFDKFQQALLVCWCISSCHDDGSL